jgi:hypothetical protein
MEPNKRKIVEFIDKDLNKMHDDDVDIEMKKLKTKLQSLPSGNAHDVRKK